jgi:hypothetical protein
VKHIIAKYQFQPWSPCKRALPEMPIYRLSGPGGQQYYPAYMGKEVRKMED